MLKKLKQTLFPVQIQTVLKISKVDSEHTQINLVELNILAKKISNKKDLQEICQYLEMYMVSNNKVLRLKAFIACHYLLTKTSNQKLLYMLSEQTQRHNKKGKFFTFIKIGEIQDFYQSYVIEPYQYYLNKLSSNFQIYQYAKNLNSSTKGSLQLVSRGFQILNLIHIILKTQEAMNKLGRYYAKYEENITLFTTYLTDLNIFNTFLKEASKKIIQASLICSDPQLIRHFYLFLTQSQKISDRLYQYYHNRYYYRQLKESQFSFPTYLQIKREDFKQIKKKVKTLDRLFYDEISQRERGKSFSTQIRIKTINEKSFVKPIQSLISIVDDKFNSTSDQMNKYCTVYNILQ